MDPAVDIVPLHGGRDEGCASNHTTASECARCYPVALGTDYFVFCIFPFSTLHKVTCSCIIILYI